MKLGSLRRRVSGRVVVAAATLLAFVLFVSALGVVLAPSRAVAASSTLTVLEGAVLVKHASAEFDLGYDGQLLQAGDVIKTDVGSRAAIVYPDGSTIAVEPESELVIEELATTASGDIVVVMRQTIGHTWHVIGRTLSSNSRYEVRTPAATASVRGTSFSVIVTEEEEVRGGVAQKVVKTEVPGATGVVELSTPAGTVRVAEDQVGKAASADEPPQVVAAPPTPKAVFEVVKSEVKDVTLVVDGRTARIDPQANKSTLLVPGAKQAEKVDEQGRVVLVIAVPVRTTQATSRIATLITPAAAAPEAVEYKVEVQDARGDVVTKLTQSASVDRATSTAKDGVNINLEAGKPVDVRPFKPDEVKEVQKPKTVGLQAPPADDAERQRRIAEAQKQFVDSQKKLADDRAKAAAAELGKASADRAKAAEERGKADEELRKAADEAARASTPEERAAAEAALKLADARRRSADISLAAAAGREKAAEQLRSAAEELKNAAGARESVVGAPALANLEEQKRRAIQAQKSAAEAQKRAEELIQEAERQKLASEKADEERKKAEEAHRKAEEALRKGAAQPAGAEGGRPSPPGPGVTTPAVGAPGFPGSEPKVAPQPGSSPGSEPPRIETRPGPGEVKPQAPIEARPGPTKEPAPRREPSKETQPPAETKPRPDVESRPPAEPKTPPTEPPSEPRSGPREEAKPPPSEEPRPAGEVPHIIAPITVPKIPVIGH